MVDTMSNTSGELNPPQPKQPRLSESLMKNMMRIPHHPPHVGGRMSSWLLFSILPGTLKIVWEKTICCRFPRPDIDAAYTPMLKINSNPMDQYRVSEVFCGINEFNSFPPSTQIQKGQKGMSPTADQSHPNNQGTFQTPRTPHFLHPGCFPSKRVTFKV